MTNETRLKDRLLALILYNYNKWSTIIPQFIAISQRYKKITLLL